MESNLFARLIRIPGHIGAVALLALSIQTITQVHWSCKDRGIALSGLQQTIFLHGHWISYMGIVFIFSVAAWDFSRKNSTPMAQFFSVSVALFYCLVIVMSALGLLFPYFMTIDRA